MAGADNKGFLAALDSFSQNGKTAAGIGTYKEKTLHSVIKRFIEPDSEKQEKPVGSFVADILNENGIIEIQTRSFNQLRKKLAFFLESYTVTVVYPIPNTKWLFWIDSDTGEVTKKRKSPKKGTFYESFYELYKIKMLLSHPNLRLRLMLIDIEEYRYLDGWSRDKKKGSTRCDRVPVAFEEELYINCNDDFKKLLPDSLPEGFTTADYAKASGLNKYNAGTALNVLFAVGAIERTGKKGNSFIYEVNN